MEEKVAQSNTYPIDGSSGAEMARLIDQSTWMRAVLGGLLPNAIAVLPGMRVLDLACGPGEWATEMAYRHPDIEVLGVDCHRAMLEYARALTLVQRVEHVSFREMDIKEPLEFRDASLDLVHGRFLAGVLEREDWLELLKECCRVLKPSGVVLLTECEGALTNSPALHALQDALFQAFFQEKRTFSLDGHSLGIIHMLGTFLDHAGLIDVQIQPFLINASFGSPHSYGALRNMGMTFLLLKSYLLHVGVIEEPVFDALYEQLVAEIRQEDYVCMIPGLQIWGRKAL